MTVSHAFLGVGAVLIILGACAVLFRDNDEGWMFVWMGGFSMLFGMA